MPLADTLPDRDLAYLAGVIAKLARNFGQLGASRRLTTLNLVLKVAIRRTVSDLVIPPMDDLDSDAPPAEQARNGVVS